jgi:cell division septal protein FtsQ
MSRTYRTRTRQKQINILHTTTARKKHSRQHLTQLGVWCGVVAAMIVTVGLALHFGLGYLLNYALYENPRYALTEIEIDPPEHFTSHMIRQAAGIELNENLWTLNLPQISHDLEKLPSISSAKVERRFPNKLVIQITERIPVVKITGLNDLGARETFYLDRDCVVLKPRENEETVMLPEVIGLTNAEVTPGMALNAPSLKRALEILDAIDHTSLHTSIDIHSIDLSQQLWITMETTHGLKITFRPGYIDQQLSRLLQITQLYANDSRTLHTIDLTPDVYVPLTFY